jgi:hypothetical protein
MNTRDGIWSPTPVTEPGIYDIDIDIYHTQACCVGPSISSTGLRTILRECPAKFWATSDLNPNRFIVEPRHTLDFGRAAHALVLGEPEFYSKFVLSPYETFRSSVAQDWRDAQTKQIIRSEEMPVIELMASAQRAAPQVARAFSEGKPEMSIIWRDEDTGVFVKVRPDWLPDFPSLRFIAEYKTARTIEPRKLSLDAFKYGYEIQAAMMMDAVKIVTGKDPLGIAHVVQEKDPPYLCDMRLFTSEQIDFGRLEYKKALHIFAHCLDDNYWPGYTREPQYFDTPFYIMKAMEDFDDYDPSRIGDDGSGDEAA